MDRGIYINRKSAASMRTPTSTLQFLSCEAAVDHWRKLPAEEQARAARRKFGALPLIILAIALGPHPLVRGETHGFPFGVVSIIGFAVTAFSIFKWCEQLCFLWLHFGADGQSVLSSRFDRCCQHQICIICFLCSYCSGVRVDSSSRASSRCFAEIRACSTRE